MDRKEESSTRNNDEIIDDSVFELLPREDKEKEGDILKESDD